MSGHTDYVEVSQTAEYKGAPFTKERYILEINAENQRIVLSILNTETDTYIEKKGEFTSYKDKGNWRCEGIFLDGTEFSAEKTMQEGAAIQSFLLMYNGEKIYWEYKLIAD